MGFELVPETFHFAAPGWLWGMAVLPVIWILYGLFYREAGRGRSALKDFADPHLLPHLLGQEDSGGKEQKRVIRALLAWSLLWLCGLLAMAGPRWDYTDAPAFAPSRNLVFLLDLSRSMDAGDIKPSRLIRARQEIQDILEAAQGVNTALVAFASVPHLITPLTDDKETAVRLLPSLETDLVFTQGSYLVPALEMAEQLLAAAPGSEKHIVILSDGGFDDGDGRILDIEKKLRGQGVQIHVLATGTVQGAPIPDKDGAYLQHRGGTVISRLERERLARIAQDGGGLYLEAEYLDGDTKQLLARVEKAGAAEEETGKVARFWDERYYLFLLPFIVLPLPWFRRNAAFPALLLMLALQPGTAQAAEWRNLFLNKEQQGRKAVATGDFDAAAQNFGDAYRRGVAQYKAGDYEAAAESFAAAARPEIAEQAHYNLGNAQLMAGRVDEAISTYEALLAQNPGHEDARHNLEIAKKLLEQQQQQSEEDQQQQDSAGDPDQQQDGENQNQDDSGEQDQQEGERDGDSQQEAEGDQQQDDESEARPQDSEGQPEEREQEGESQQAKRSQQDIDADQWLNRLESDPRSFLRNKFYIESQRRGAKPGENPW